MKTITYTRRSLACQYFPDAEPEQAVRRLTSWIPPGSAAAVRSMPS